MWTSRTARGRARGPTRTQRACPARLHPPHVRHLQGRPALAGLCAARRARAAQLLRASSCAHACGPFGALYTLYPILYPNWCQARSLAAGRARRACAAHWPAIKVDWTGVDQPPHRRTCKAAHSFPVLRVLDLRARQARSAAELRCCIASACAQVRRCTAPPGTAPGCVPRLSRCRSSPLFPVSCPCRCAARGPNCGQSSDTLTAPRSTRPVAGLQCAAQGGGHQRGQQLAHRKRCAPKCRHWRHWIAAARAACSPEVSAGPPFATQLPRARHAH